MKANLEISESNLKEVATLLNRLLANEFLLYAKTRGAHWNIEGCSFIGLHKFLEDQYKELDVIIDDTAERIRSLGHFALASLKDYLKITDMLENDSDFESQGHAILQLTHDHETIIKLIRNEIFPISDQYKDLGTADFVTSIMKQHEKMSWMLRAHLNEVKSSTILL